MVGTASAREDQSDASYSSSEDSFCLQIQAKSAKDNTKKDKPQHLVTNIPYKLKSHRRRTKFPRAKIDMFQCQPHTYQCVQTDIQRSRLYKA